MNSALLQWLALFTMAVDHVGYLLLPDVELLRVIGRIAFPLFVFLLTEGFVHTHDRWRYLGRLTVFALISEVPYRIFTNGGRFWSVILSKPCTNIFFELLLIFIALWSIQSALEKNKLFFGLTALCLVMAVLMDTMYGWYGVVMGICFYLFRDKRYQALLCLGILTVLYCVVHGSAFQLSALLAAIPLWFYNGERGPRLPKYFGYIFYPAHLMLLYGVYCLIK